jgi:hypothetical protein
MMTGDEIVELLPKIEFGSNGNIQYAINLECLCDGDKWETSNKQFVDIFADISKGKTYRIKSVPKYVPFTFEDAELFWLKRIHKRDKAYIATIIDYDDKNIFIYGEDVSFKDLLDEYEFVPDGSPAGRLVE